MSEPSPRKLGVLIHGAGWVAGQHAAAFTGNPATEVLAVSSRSRASADRLVGEQGLGAATYDRLDAALAHQGIDIVCICTPQHVHCDNVLAAAAAGKHIVIEKPAAISLDELRRMQDAVAKAGVKTIVSFVLRWNPLFQQIKKRIAKGDLGRVFSVETDYLSYNADWWGGWEDGRRAETGVSAMAVAGCKSPFPRPPVLLNGSFRGFPQKAKSSSYLVARAGWPGQNDRPSVSDDFQNIESAVRVGHGRADSDTVDVTFAGDGGGSGSD